MGRGGALRFLLKSKTVTFGLIVVSLFIFSACAAPLLAGQSPTRINIPERLQPPSSKHIFGTDHLGRDLFAQVVYGSRLSLSVAVISVAIAAAAGIPLGLVAGYSGGTVDNVIMRVMDLIFAFPSLLLAIAVVAFLGPSTQNVMIAIGTVYTAGVCRITRSTVLTVKNAEYVLAAKAVGYKDLPIMFKQILPNAFGPIVVQLTLLLARAILYEASLSFIGLGTPPPTPSWGRMISDARSYLAVAPWTALAPGIVIMCIVLGINFVGDGLRDLLDPRLRRA